MEKTVGAFEARRQFGPILKQVSARGDSYVVEYHGEPVAAVVPIGVYKKWKQRRENLIARMRTSAAQGEMTPEAAIKLVEEEIQASQSEH